MTHSFPAKRSKLLLWIGALLILFGSIFAYVGWYSIQLERQYETNGLKVQGTISGKKIEETWETDSQTKRRTKRTSYYVEYRFQPANESVIESKDSVSLETYNQAKDGDPVEIQYLPSDLSKNRIATASDYVFGYLFMAFGSLMIFPGLYLCVYDFKKRSLIKRLTNDGMLVEATIESVGPGNLTINNVTQWRIGYSFKDIRGLEQHGKSEHLAPQKVKELKVGDKGKVKYDRNNPSLNIWIGK